MNSAVSSYSGGFDPRRTLGMAALFVGFALYVGLATLATLVYPLALPVFLAPAAVLIVAFAPRGRSVPKTIIMPLLLTAIALMPVWPVFLHLVVGPLPLLTPPRTLLYLVTAIWLYDMTVSPWRRAQFLVALRRRKVLAGCVLALFSLGALSVLFAEGKILAANAYFREFIIFLLPFCVFVTYVRRWRDLRKILIAIAVGATIAGMIAIIEAVTQTLLASVLSPLIMMDAEWLRITQAAKIRDGVFRAQATHTHPLSLGEFLCFAAPLAVAFMVEARKAKRLMWAIALTIIVAAILATNSRAALIALFPGCGFVAIMVLIRTMQSQAKRRLRPAVGLACLGMIAASPVILYGGYSLATGDAGTSAARSSQSRVDQVTQAWPKIMQRPVTGYGSGRSARVVGYYGRSLTLDNYYLSLAVDLGLTGPLLFLAILIAAVQCSLKDASAAPRIMRWALVGLAGAFSAFILSRLILSQIGNLNTIYPVLGALLGASAASQRTVKKTSLTDWRI